MDDATKEELRLDTLHNEELLRVEKTQAQAREHRKLMLDLEHQAVHDAVITCQKALNEQEYEHCKRMLKLERQYASTEVAARLSESAPESETKSAGSGKEAAAEPAESFPGSENAGCGNENSEIKGPKRDGGKTEEFLKMAKRAAERTAEKRRG